MGCSVNVSVLCVACVTVFVNCLVKQLAMCLGVIAILLLNVMDVFSVCGGALLDRPCMVFQRVCVLCMTCSLLMLVEDAIGDHTEEAYSRAGLITAL